MAQRKIDFSAMLQDLLETEKSLEPTKQVSFKEETVLLINYDADEPPNTVTPKEMTPINCITPILKSSSSSVIPDIVPCEPDLDIFDEESYKDESDGASESEQEDEDIEIQGEEDPEPNSDTYSLNSDEKGSFFEQVTVEDYEDMDRLLDDLEKYMKKKPTVDTNVPHVQSIPSGSDDSSPSSIKAKKVDMIMSKLSEANVKKVHPLI
ncbi:hypothetical protein EDD86DRAFT_146951 [Gorgonomyces haynaldii]|nr:hypothetical protein EDD86DRAFT_146951 [Gorgonomyces haynaldii]